LISKEKERKLMLMENYPLPKESLKNLMLKLMLMEKEKVKERNLMRMLMLMVKERLKNPILILTLISKEKERNLMLMEN